MNQIKGAKYPIAWMPEEITWDFFRENLDNHAILLGKFIALLEFKVDQTDENYTRQRDEIRTILKDLELAINYSDVYEKKFEIKRKLDWFGRNLE